MSAAKAAITSLGREIQYGLLSDNVGPMIFTFTGAGNVSQVRVEYYRVAYNLNLCRGPKRCSKNCLTNLFPLKT